MYRELTFSDFRTRRGDTFDVRGPAGVVKLVLAQVQELPGSGRQGGSFRLEFQGPLTPALGQGTFPFMIGRDWANIFIVPVGILPQAMRYEAIFY
jgi:uncharacterized protein DUF6916